MQTFFALLRLIASVLAFLGMIVGIGALAFIFNSVY